MDKSTLKTTFIFFGEKPPTCGGRQDMDYVNREKTHPLKDLICCILTFSKENQLKLKRSASASCQSILGLRISAGFLSRITLSH